MEWATFRGGEFPITSPKISCPLQIHSRGPWAAWLEKGARNPQERRYCLREWLRLFQEEATNPHREPFWPRALDNPKLPFWGFFHPSDWREGQGGRAAPDTSWQQCWAGADSLAPHAFALNAGLGGDWQQDGRERKEMSPSLSQRTASEPRSWCPWAGLWGKGEDWAPGSGQVWGCRPFHRQVGPGWNEMSFCFQWLPTFGKRDGLYRESCLVRSFWRTTLAQRQVMLHGGI